MPDDTGMRRSMQMIWETVRVHLNPDRTCGRWRDNEWHPYTRLYDDSSAPIFLQCIWCRGAIHYPAVVAHTDRALEAVRASFRRLMVRETVS